MKISNAARSAMVDALTALLDGGTIEIRTGAAPTNTSDADSGTLLAELTFDDPAFGAASNGVAAAGTITPDSSTPATGTAQHFRMKASGGAVVVQGTVSTSGADMNFNTTSFVSGGTCSLTSGSVTQPASP